MQDKFLNDVLAKEMLLILIFGTLLILAILTLGTISWFEPVLFLTVIFISIVINLGSNIILGEISSITLSIAAVLQLAVAMDYTIILLDNFTKERKRQLRCGRGFS
ncbi:MAG: MMPL family transporter [Syntrophomonadaceae bacterium]